MQKKSDKESIHLSVRKLVESVLDTGGGQSINRVRAAQGRDAHRAVQASQGNGYRAEVPISGEVVLDRQLVIISGRMDGILEEDGMWVVDEIKLTLPGEGVNENKERERPEHWAQIMVYCWLWAMDQDLDMVVGRLTRATPEGVIIGREDREFTREETVDFSLGLVARFLEELKAGERWRLLRDASISAMPFPFARPRKGQMELAMEVQAMCRQGGKLLAEAPTGLGKTMGVLYPAVKALAQGAAKWVFYLTAKTTGKSAAEQALEHMRRKGLRIRSTTLTAKDRICPNPARECIPGRCDLLDGYFKHSHRAMSQALEYEDFTRVRIETVAENKHICPFELGLDLAFISDVIIGDYNHALDPRARLTRFFERDKGPKILLFDEAHNLVERSRAIFSATLAKGMLPSLARALKAPWPECSKAIEALNTWFLESFRDRQSGPGAFIAEHEAPWELDFLLDQLVQTIMDGPLRDERFPEEGLVELYYEARHILSVLEGYGEGHATLYRGGGAKAEVELACLDPAESLDQALDLEGAAIFFSATLGPAEYYSRMFGFRNTDCRLSMDSPFPPEHLGLFVSPVSTLYRNRERTGKQVAEALLAQFSARPGRYLFFFPSYAYLRLIHDTFQYLAPYVPTLTQDRNMGERERERFLKAFDVHLESASDQSLAGFAVLGGVFGEGIDLVGERLHGAAIVGVGLPPPSQRLDLIREHFSLMDEPGYHYVYTYPGLTKVLQAAGRVIRTEKDRGTLLLIDERWSRRDYQQLMPRHWQPRFVQDINEIEQELETFWR